MLEEREFSLGVKFFFVHHVWNVWNQLQAACSWQLQLKKRAL